MARTLAVAMILVWLFIVAEVSPLKAGLPFEALILGSSSVAPLMATFGGIVPQRILDGQVWRVLTAGFVHIGLLDLVATCAPLLVLGRQLETYLGPVRLLHLFVTASAVGYALSIAFATTVAAGGTPGICGVIFALAGIQLRGNLNGFVSLRDACALGVAFVVVGLWVAHNPVAHAGAALSGLGYVWVHRQWAIRQFIQSMKAKSEVKRCAEHVFRDDDQT